MNSTVPKTWSGAPLRYSWDWKDEYGKIFGCTARYESVGDRKQIIPFFVRNNGLFDTGGQEKPTKLFGLQTLVKSDSDRAVFIAEGEKVTSALQSLGIPAVTSGSSSSAEAADWQPILNFKQAYILPDNDDCGRAYCRDIIHQIRALSSEITIYVVEIPDLPFKGDLVDWIREIQPEWEGYEPIPDKQHTLVKDKLKVIIKNQRVRDTQWLLKQSNTNQTARITQEKGQAEISGMNPLQRELPPASDFPVHALGMLAPVSEEIASVIQAPVAICGQSVLAAACLAVQAFANLNIDGRRIPLSEFFVSVGMSGERKSAVDNTVLVSHREYQTSLQDDYLARSQQYDRDTKVYKHSQDEALKSNKGSHEEKKQALIKLGPAPVPPLKPIILLEEPTYEGLVKLLADGQPSLGLFSDEGGRMIGGYGMSPENILKTAAGLSNLWDAKPISRVRAGDGAFILSGRRFCFHIMVQPAAANKMLASNLLIDQGLLSRCLVSWPESTAGKRFYNEKDLSAEEIIQQYNLRILSILKRPPSLADGRLNQLAPRSINLSDSAKRLYIDFHDFIEERLKKGKEYHSIRGFANKVPEHALRLAGILALVQDLSCEIVNSNQMTSGIDLAKYYLGEAQRLFALGSVDNELVTAEELYQWLIKRNKDVITLPEIYQKGPQTIRTVRQATKFMKILENHGRVSRKQDGADYDGVRRKVAFRINKNGSNVV
jgi:hypothetical protein